jgi:RND family efflux transporter MFP subunit
MISMKNKNKVILAIVILTIVAIVVLKIINASGSADQRKQPNPLVKIETPQRETIINALKFTGDITPIQQAGIFSKVSGNLEKIYADMGAYVQKGQLLAQIDTTEIYQQFQQMSATYQNAKLTYQRNKDLSEQNLIAKQDLDNADAAMKVAGANFEAARIRLDYARITAPFSGFITKRFLDPGALVTSNNATLFTLMDLNAMKIIVNVLEKDIPLAKIGKKALVTVDAFPGEEFHGDITRISEAVDLSTRTMAVEVDIPNPKHMLKPGMFANVTIIVGERNKAITVPTQAIMRDSKGFFLFVVNDKMAKRISVNPGVEQNNRTEILSGLDGSENVITTGQQFVKDGGSVIIQQ